MLKQVFVYGRRIFIYLLLFNVIPIKYFLKKKQASDIIVNFTSVKALRDSFFSTPEKLDEMKWKVVTTTTTKILPEKKILKSRSFSLMT